MWFWQLLTSWPFFVSVAFVVGIFVASILWKRDIHQRTALPKKTDRRKFPMKRVDGVLTDFERGAYRTLQHEIGKDYYLFPKVRLENVVALSRKSKREEFYHNLLKTREVDLLACDRDKLAPMMVIQIIEGAQQNDDEELTAHLIRSADIPCVQIQLKKSFSPTELMELVREAIKKRQQESLLGYHEVKKRHV